MVGARGCACGSPARPRQEAVRTARQRLAATSRNGRLAVPAQRSRPPRGVAVIGATGSIGRHALEVIARHPDRLRAVALAAGTRWESACELAVACGAEVVALSDPGAARRAGERLSGSPVRVLAGPEGVAAAAAWPSADVTLAAATGIAGLPAVMAALAARKNVALANKESLVAGGRLVTTAAAAAGAALLPVDGEHSGIFQCLRGRAARDLSRLWLTASGGPFRTWPAARLESATPAQALAHPVWRMGPRITVDSATLLNKGFEVVEACWLFGVSPEAVGVLVHPQGILHALVEFADGAQVAQCSCPDMRLPILYALSYPERWPWGGRRLDLADVGALTFEAPDAERFPCLWLPRAAAEAGGTAPAALNAADEVAVERFLAGDISFGDIPRLLTDTLTWHRPTEAVELGAILAADREARAFARGWRRRLVAGPAARDRRGEPGHPAACVHSSPPAPPLQGETPDADAAEGRARA